MRDVVPVTKTFLPPQYEYKACLSRIWHNNQLTNQGPLLKELEAKICQKLKIDNMDLVANGTLALQLAIDSLDIHGGEIITTPFTYVATVSAVLWQRCKPVFVDINPDTLNIDATKIEAAITNNTKAILPVHVFGNPCDVDAIGSIARQHNLPVIYDAAHCFGVQYKDKSVYAYGDISIGSFHATKLFHTIEGGGIFINRKNPNLEQTIELKKRFGHQGDTHYMLGINAKNSEFHAAMGLCNLKYIDELIEKRKTISDYYSSKLKNIKRQQINDSASYNYAYYPIILKTEGILEKVVSKLNAKNIFPRRYFYPSLNNLPYISHKNSCPQSEDIAGRILCLPLYHDLDFDVIDNICEVINEIN